MLSVPISCQVMNQSKLFPARIDMDVLYPCISFNFSGIRYVIYDNRWLPIFQFWKLKSNLNQIDNNLWSFTWKLWSPFFKELTLDPHKLVHGHETYKVEICWLHVSSSCPTWTHTLRPNVLCRDAIPMWVLLVNISSTSFKI